VDKAVLSEKHSCLICKGHGHVAVFGSFYFDQCKCITSNRFTQNKKANQSLEDESGNEKLNFLIIDKAKNSRSLASMKSDYKIDLKQ